MVRKLSKRILLVIVLFTVLSGVFSCFQTSDSEIVYKPVTIDEATYVDYEEGTFRAYVLNVGEASCLVIESDGEYAVVDAGDDNTASYVFSAISKPEYIGTTRITYLFFTHFHEDHIGAGPGLIEKLKVKEVYGPNYEPAADDNNSLRTYNSLKTRMRSKGLKMHCPISTEELELGQIKIKVIPPYKITSDDNKNSLALLFYDQYGNVLYVGGDSEKENEKKQLDEIDKIDVYIVNHHGSNTSSSEEFISATQPRYAVISCSEGSSKHPSPEVLERLKRHGCEIYYTYKERKSGENLSIVFSEDGIAIH